MSLLLTRVLYRCKVCSKDRLIGVVIINVSYWEKRAWKFHKKQANKWLECYTYKNIFELKRHHHYIGCVMEYLMWECRVTISLSGKEGDTFSAEIGKNTVHITNTDKPSGILDGDDHIRINSVPRYKTNRWDSTQRRKMQHNNPYTWTWCAKVGMVTQSHLQQEDLANVMKRRHNSTQALS